jgi:hypothetical protein
MKFLVHLETMATVQNLEQVNFELHLITYFAQTEIYNYFNCTSQKAGAQAN